jgi:hypothetical protein
MQTGGPARGRYQRRRVTGEHQPEVREKEPVLTSWESSKRNSLTRRTTADNKTTRTTDQQEKESKEDDGR